MVVLKFGGTSVATAANIKRIKSILQAHDEQVVVVVSALSGMTDSLQKMAQNALSGIQNEELSVLKDRHFEMVKELITLNKQGDVLIFVQQQFTELERILSSISSLGELTDKTLARVMSFGEQLSAHIIHNYLKQEGLDNVLFKSNELIRANGNYLNATVDMDVTESLIREKVNGMSGVAPGFCASNENGETVLLGRGGTDYTASIYASSVEAARLEIWSDVNGMLEANPKVVANPETISYMTYKEALELSHFGAKVLYPPTIGPAMKKKIPIFLKNTFSPEDEGTLIGDEKRSEKDYVKGVSSLSDVGVITVAGAGLSGMKDGVRRIFQAIEKADVHATLITQCSSEQSLCLGIHENDLKKAETALNREFEPEISNAMMNPVKVADDLSIVVLVGDNMRQRTGLSGKVFSTLGENGINITAIAQGASERNISIVVDRNDEVKAIRVLHEQFFSKAKKKVHLFVVGVGNVGGTFVKFIEEQKHQIVNERDTELKIVGVANSKKMLFDPKGISVARIDDLGNEGTSYDHIGEFVAQMSELNLRNSVFIDNTSAEIVSACYEEVLKQSISVVTCNKIASTSPFSNYQRLLRTAKEKNCHFKFETCVGAGLPVLTTLQNQVWSGDKIHKIQAVLSGSLNFIFNNYDASETFSEVVKKARANGLMEPNPADDLSGMDVMRKILILARISGCEMELDEVTITPIVPDECMQAQSVEDFFERLSMHESYFRERFEAAKGQDKKLRVIATFDNGQAGVSLEAVDKNNVFYQLEGKDNIVSVHSDRYPEEPLVVKGAGAGAQVTAGGIFSDLMLILNQQ